MTSLVAFIIGSGTNVGKSVANTLKSHGYKVALGSRNPNIEETKKEGFFPVAIDITKTDTIVPAFEEISKHLGAPNVVVFNAATFNPPPTPDDPLSYPDDGFKDSINVASSVFIAAQQALKAFRSHSSSNRAFITTGNILPFLHEADLKYFGLGYQKVAEAYYMEVFSRAYQKEGIRFHYAHLVGEDGGIPPYPDFARSGEVHAKVYWDLISNSKPEKWDYRFTLDGKKYDGY